MREPFCRARAYFTILLVLEVILGIAIIAVTFVYHCMLGSYMAKHERKMLTGQFFNTYLLGFQLIVMYLISIGMWKCLWTRRCTPNVGLLLTIWMFFCFLVVLCGFGTIWSLYINADSIANAAEISLFKGIDLYYSCPEWKLLWDQLQYHKECCGVHGYRDWMKASWMPAEANDTNDCSGDEKSILVPYACCKHSCTSCYENYMPRSENNHIPFISVSQINCEGCLPIFRSKVCEASLILLGLIAVAFKSVLVICGFAKYIIRTQETDDCECVNMGFGSDDPQPMVAVNCPINVRCITLDGVDDMSTFQLCQKNKVLKNVQMREPFCRARAYFTTLLVLEVILGSTIIAVTFVYHRMLGSYMAKQERKMLTGQFFNTYLLGIQLIAVYLISIGMWKCLWMRRCTPNVGLLLTIWMFFCFLIVICGFGTIWSLFISADSIANTAEISLFKGIDLYYSCPEWKLLWDQLQYHKECCGVHGYRDWMKASWMPAEANDTNDCSGEEKSILAPYACCKHSCTSCYENYMPRSENNHIPFLSVSQINCEGCLPMFRTKVWEASYILLGLVVAAFQLDIIICCFAKYIVRKQETDDCECDNLGFGGDDSQPMVVVKCPANVRCVTLDGVDDMSTFQLCQKNKGKKGPCNCCSGVKVPGGYSMKQDCSKQPAKTAPSKVCGTCSKTTHFGGGGTGGNDPRIVH